MIKPTIGRVVWFHPGKGFDGAHLDQPLPALIAYVHTDHLINIGGWDANGVPFRATSVELAQEGMTPTTSWYCEWMPYQKGQAAKYEALEKERVK